MFDKTLLKAAAVSIAVLLCLVLLSSIAGAANALNAVNAKRAQLGLYPLIPDANLQAAAEQTSQVRASRRVKLHLPRKLHRYTEGVGYGYRQFKACFHKERGGGTPPYTTSHTHAGAAVAFDAAGRPYYTIVLMSGRPTGQARKLAPVARTRAQRRPARRIRIFRRR